MAPNAQLRVSDDKSTLIISWKDGHVTRSHVKRLRFHCRCERCVPSFSGLMPVDRDAFPEDMIIVNSFIKDEMLHMEINQEAMENHVTTIPMDWLRDNCNCETCMKIAITQSDLKFGDPKVIPRISYESLESKQGKFECLKKVFDDGFCIIANVPREHLAVQKVGRMFGIIRSTLYGDFFDVENKVDPYNAAYTSHGLPFHMDLPFYEAMPGVQLLHAMDFDDSIRGGESQLVDLYHAVDILRRESPEDFEALCRIPVTFQTIDLIRPEPCWYEAAKTHIEVDYFGNVVSILWHPGLEGQLRIRPEDEGAYYKAYVNFMKIVKRPELEYLFRLKPGDLILFNNRRMSHARKGFTQSSGVRHLQGSYINLDDMKSTYIVLANQIGKKVAPPKCGNRSWF